MMNIKKLKKGNEDFENTFKENKKLYLDLAVNGQHPKVLWIGCSDSRIVPEFIVKANAGDLFVTRNIANIIPPEKADNSCTSSVLEYAVLHLKVEHIVICGHTGCGGITALVNGTPKNSQIEKWLKHAIPAKKKDAKILDTIKENVLLQANNLLTFDYIAKKNGEKKIRIHKWLYEMNLGKIFYFDDNRSGWFPIN